MCIYHPYTIHMLSKLTFEKNSFKDSSSVSEDFQNVMFITC